MLANELIGLRELDAWSAACVEARNLRDIAPGELSIEQARQLQDADRMVQRLTSLDLSQIEADALGRYGDLIAAAKGMTMREVGPIAHKFRTDKAAVSTIMGPYGSAKTTTGFQKIINSVMWQPPGPDGVRRARWCIVRDTYGHLETNIMADWFMWFPKNEKNYNLRTNTHKLRLDVPLAGGQVMKLYLEVLFRAVESQSAEELFKGLALTGLWLNEMDTLHYDVFKYGFPRLGRYRAPGTRVGGWSGLIGDMNAPAEDNWTYDFNVNKNIGLTEDQMREYRKVFGDNFRVNFHVQPGGLDAGAENLTNLPPGYYDRIQIGMNEQEKRRFIHNKFGAVRDGNPVYTQYSDDRHCVRDLKVDSRVPVNLALDGGNTPACLFGQKMPNGQIRIVDEVVIYKPGKKAVLEKLGAKEFGQQCGEYWNENFAGCRLADVNWGDPACWYGDSAKNEEDRAWIIRFVEGFNETAIGVKLKIKPAPVKANRIGPRLEAVRDVLKGSIDAVPKFVISDRCKVLREGFNRGYVTTRVEYSTGGGRWKDEPLKNDFSHVHDTNQYLVLGLTKFDGWEDAEKGERQRRAATQGRRPKVDYGRGYFSPVGG